MGRAAFIKNRVTSLEALIMIFGRIFEFLQIVFSLYINSKITLPIVLQIKKLIYKAGRLTTFHSKQVMKSKFEFRFSNSNLKAL